VLLVLHGKSAAEYSIDFMEERLVEQNEKLEEIEEKNKANR